MRAVIYARYSSDKQSETSLEDQVTLCQSRARREGWQVVATHTDTAISGSTQVSARPGGKALLADMLAGRFDVLLLESLDRLSRDQVEQETIVRRLEHRGVRIICLADGYDSQFQGRKVMRGVRGLINEMYLDDLRHKTQRGLHGQIDRGYIAGGKSYGYDIVRDEHGSRFVINELEAHWVRWIFRQAAKGMAYRQIVYELNERGVKSPRGSSWAVSAIYGSPRQGTGIINNMLYIGRYIWNRSQWIKDPDTGKRRRVDRPRNEWRETEVPDLRIVDSVTWLRVQGRLANGRKKDGSKPSRRPLTALLSGTLRCPHCDGPMTLAGSKVYACGVGRDRGPAVCRGFRISRLQVERRLLSVIRDDLLSDEAAEVFATMVRSRMEQLGAQTGASVMAGRQERLKEELQRLVDAVATLGVSEALAQRIRSTERELRTIEEEIRVAADAAPERLDAGKELRKLLMNLEGALKASPTEARHAVSEILGPVKIQLKEAQVWAEIATGPALRIAVGAGYPITGCGGRI